MASEQQTLETGKTISLDALPTEVVLEIIPYIPFSPQTLTCLRRTSKRLHHIISRHEHGLVTHIKRTQIPAPSLHLFPSLHTSTFPGLATLHHRLTNLTHLHAKWLEITSRGGDLAWLRGRWEAIHKAGQLVLYRVQDGGSYCEKVAVINGLPATALACLLFNLVATIKILRVHGPSPIRGTYRAGDVLARSDIELALEEMLLVHGPDFFMALLLRRGNGDGVPGDGEEKGKARWAISALETEIDGMIERQRPTPEGIPKPPTLTSCMRRAFAAKLGCHVSQNVGKMWEMLSTTCFDHMDEAKMVEVVMGAELEGGVKRLF